MAPSSSAFAVTARKVPPLALVPRSQLQASRRASALAKPPPAVPEPAVPQQHEAGRRPSLSVEPPPPRRQTPEDEKTLLRLGERFLNVMALMARLARQPLSDAAASPAPEPQREAPAVAAAPAATSPVHVVRAVGERVPPALREQLTFDICMLLPAPQPSPLHSPIRRKRLRKRLRRRRRRRPRRSWQASYVSWVPHASADYIEHHARQDLAAASAARLVDRLQDHRVKDQRLLSGKTTLPPLYPSGSQQASKVADDVDEHDHHDHDHDAVPKRNHDHEAEEVDADEHDQEDDEEEEDEEVSWSWGSDFLIAVVVQRRLSRSPLTLCVICCSQSIHDDVVVVVPPQLQALEPAPPSVATPAKKPPLFHQPAWISPELRAWLVASGLFSTRPRRELLPPGV
ncbi:hypothetical protein BBJ28_00021895 [Nothophytophthora sp. Chile5]|nr:hypothetical protein BBJ28_00021895 [Nothophytophthora sp. Chile5]